MGKGLLNFFSSLRLTVVCLSLAIVLVFIGTFAQVRLGLYVAQEDFFRSFFVYWGPERASWKIPILPGGWLLGMVLLVNLIAAHLKRFKLSSKRIGIFLIHGGLIFLLLGQFLTELFQIESHLRIAEGETRNYTEDSRKNELAVIDVSNPAQDTVVAIPASLLKKDKEIRHAKLPFAIRVKEYFPNSFPTTNSNERSAALSADQGVGQRLFFSNAEKATKMDDEDKPAALIEISSSSGRKGDWVVSTWLTRIPELMNKPQSFEVEGRQYQLALRQIRYYNDYSIKLIDFSHDRYKGTDKPKNFSSRIHLQNLKTGEDRDVLIYMNNPLRYAGQTYYQGSFDPRDDTVSILHVVRNPAWLTPYLSCFLVGAGLLWQFLSHLISFGRRGPATKPQQPEQRRDFRSEPELASAGAGSGSKRRTR